MFAFKSVPAATVDVTLRDDAQPFTGPEEWVALREARGATIRRHGRVSMVTCPAHGDRTPSLELKQGHSQPVVFKCHAGCTQDAVLAADGLTWAHVLYRTAQSTTFASRVHDKRISALRLDSDNPHDRTVSLSAFSFVVLRGDLSLRRRGWLWYLWPEPQWQHQVASHELVLPKGAGRVMGVVAADLVSLANHRISNGELRAIPYTQRFGALRLDVDQGSVGRALRRLRDRGLITPVGSLPSRLPVRTADRVDHPFDFQTVRRWEVDAPPPWNAIGATLWALRVVPCALPQSTRRVERADRVSVFDFETLTASEAPGRVRQPHAKLGLEPGVTLADLSVA